ELAGGMRDKALLLRFNDGARQYPSTKAEHRKIVESELEYFLRWLLDWRAPAEIAVTSRFVMRAFIDHDTRPNATRAQPCGDLLEWIDLWIRRNGFESDYWSGTAAEWLIHSKGDDALKNLINIKSAPVLGRKFKAAASLPDSGITILDDDSRRHSVTYQID